MGEEERGGCLLEIRLPSRETEILGAADRTLEAVRRAGFAGEGAPRLKLAIVELVSNAIEHGNDFDPLKLVTVRVRRAGARLLISVADEGSGLDPRAVDRDLDRIALEQKRGRGLGLVKKIVGAPPAVNEARNEVTIAFERERFA
jgi:anti-sigma regulatory factor (Ser/Thr protein kinase)